MDLTELDIFESGQSGTAFLDGRTRKTIQGWFDKYGKDKIARCLYKFKRGSTIEIIRGYMVVFDYEKLYDWYNRIILYGWNQTTAAQQMFRIQLLNNRYFS